MFFGVDPTVLLESMGPSAVSVQQPAPAPAGQDEASKFVSVVLADTEDTWRGLFRQMGGTYQEPKLVLFSGMAQSACGYAQAAVGPFYCPADQKVYVDLSFFEDLKNRFRAPGDFAQAYVIAHEVGHHVQNLLGISDKVESLRARLGALKATRYRCGWNCRRIVLPEFGRTSLRKPGKFWKRATSRKR